MRLAAVFLVGTLLFLLARGFLVPRSFGQYGHYRGNAIAEIAAHPVAFAGHQTCEACHGALAKHAEDPVSVKPAKLQAAVLCARCHEANIAKPKQFPQVVPAEHSGGAACDMCHQPHSPALDSGKRK